MGECGILRKWKMLPSHFSLQIQSGDAALADREGLREETRDVNKDQTWGSSEASGIRELWLVPSRGQDEMWFV